MQFSETITDLGYLSLIKSEYKGLPGPWHPGFGPVTGSKTQIFEINPKNNTKTQRITRYLSN